jgi:hypothetical protein
MKHSEGFKTLYGILAAYFKAVTSEHTKTPPADETHHTTIKKQQNTHR